ncbi:MAG: endonuclease/exonuclease/phosphatase family protein [Acidimicrobiales bacterium]|nr:endonuclease/exonuclease/phosphatase family protein [Acidimicrobiales bacterium]
MRRLAILAVASLLLGAAACSGSGPEAATDPGDGGPVPEATSGTVRLLAYNVAGLPQEISKVTPAEDLPQIGPLLEDYDLVLTQEDFDWWDPDGLASGLDFTSYHEHLWADTTFAHRTEPHPGPEAVDLDPTTRPDLELGDGLAVGSRFPLVEVERVPWTRCFGGLDTSDGGAADCLAMKGFLFARVELADGVLVDVYDLHVEAGGSELDQQLQADDIAQLQAYIAEHSEGRAVIVAGDTNLHTDVVDPADQDVADGPLWAGLLDALGLTDACDATDCPEPGRIDKAAFRSGDGVALEVTSHAFRDDVFVDDGGEDLSDHQPLEVIVDWTAD